MGLGFFTFSLPHFLVGPYRADIPENNVCGKSGNGTATSSCSSDANENGMEDLSWNVWFFFVAQLLHGIGDYKVAFQTATWPYLCSFFPPHFRRFPALHPRRYLHRRQRLKKDVERLPGWVKALIFSLFMSYRFQVAEKHYHQRHHHATEREWKMHHVLEGSNTENNKINHHKFHYI